MIRTTTLAAGIALVLALTACAPPAAEPTTAPTTTPTTAPTAPASTTPPDASATESAEPSGSGEPAGQVFETQDGAMRVTLPEGWSVDDRSAMGEPSEMYDRGPGWLNDVVLLDEDGDQMLWYREQYGNDFVDCTVVPADVAQPVDPFAPALRERLDAEAAAEGRPAPELQIRSGLQEVTEWDGAQDVPTGEWTASLDLTSHLWHEGEDCGWAEEVWTGSRIVMVGAVGDQPGADGPGSQISFGSQQAALDWFAGAEVAQLLEVLESLEITDAPLLDREP